MKEKPRRAVQFGDEEAGHSHVLEPCLGLIHCIPAHRSIDHEEGFMRSFGNDSLDGRLHALQLLDQLHVVAQPARGVDDDHIEGAVHRPPQRPLDHWHGIASSALTFYTGKKEGGRYSELRTDEYDYTIPMGSSMETLARTAHSASCSTAAALKVSQAPSSTVMFPSFAKREASLPMEVVFPIPLAPMTKMTVGPSSMGAKLMAGEVFEGGVSASSSRSRSTLTISSSEISSAKEEA